jgi:hypothetical protein
MNSLKLRIGTFNIRNTTDHYEKRLPLMQKTFTEMNSDVIGLQEVSFLDKDQLMDLNIEGNYYTYMAPTQMNYAKTNEIKDEFFNIDGNAIMIKKESDHGMKYSNIRHQVLHLSPIRCAQMLSFNIEEFGNLEVILNAKINYFNHKKTYCSFFN